MSDPDVQLELTLIALADRLHKARLRELLPSKRGREKFLGTLYHNPPFDPRYVTVMEYHHTLEKELVARGAPAECYVIANDSEYDARIMPLADALYELIGWQDGFILLCIPGRLAFYCGEPGPRGGYEWIIERPT